MEKYLSLYILLLLCLKVNVCVLGGFLVSKKDIDLAKSIVKANTINEKERSLIGNNFKTGTIFF